MKKTWGIHDKNHETIMRQSWGIMRTFMRKSWGNYEESDETAMRYIMRGRQSSQGAFMDFSRCSHDSWESETNDEAIMRQSWENHEEIMSKSWRKSWGKSWDSHEKYHETAIEKEKKREKRTKVEKQKRVRIRSVRMRIMGGAPWETICDLRLLLAVRINGRYSIPPFRTSLNISEPKPPIK